MTTSAISRIRRTAVASALLLGVAASTATATARRHFKVLRTAPAADTSLTVAPKAISMWTSEPVQLSATRFVLETPAGVKVELGKPTRTAEKNAPVVVPISKPLAAGKWHVTWRTMSDDGHVVSGDFNFTLK